MTESGTWLAAADRPMAERSSADDWARWFMGGMMPAWVDRAADPVHGGFFDSLAQDATPITGSSKTCLAQARVLFTLSHLALVAPDPAFIHGADAAYAFLTRHLLRAETGGYVRAVTRDGGPTGLAQDAVARSYDQSFVVLALATYDRLAPSSATQAQLHDCWRFIETRLTDPATGLLIEDDSVADPAAPDAPPRAQNPHMHMFEAALQAYEMTGDPAWMRRADRLMTIALRCFLDPATGAIVEFRAPDLSPEPGADGAPREIGHQCEWVWLLHRHARLRGDDDASPVCARLMDFASRFGFCDQGPMRGASRDAVNADGAVAQESFLLWPQTEAGKAHIARFEHGRRAPDSARACEIAVLMFSRYFAGRAAWCNQLDPLAQVLQPEALSRLLYHVALFVTEGSRVGLWRAQTDARRNI